MMQQKVAQILQLSTPSCSTRCGCPVLLPDLRRTALSRRSLCSPPRSSVEKSGVDNSSRIVSAPKLADNEQPSPDPLSFTEEPRLNTQPSTSGRSVPYSVVAALAGAGVVETAYLTAVKWFSVPLACPVSGCETVLNSEYSELFGIPLSLFGLLAYGGVAALALAGRAQAAAPGGGSSSNSLDTALVAGVATLGGCSAVLIYLLLTQWQGETCAWCYASAALSLSSLVAVVSGLPAYRLSRAALPGAGALAASVALLYFGFGGLGSSSSEEFSLEYQAPLVVNQSTDRAVDLARRLRDAGAKMYGAFWCSHCHDQKEFFGREAMAYFPYVECYPNGFKRGVTIEKACDDAQVKAFPSWVLDGKLIEGELQLDELESKLLAANKAK